MTIFVRYNLDGAYEKPKRFNSFAEIPNYDEVVSLKCSHNQLNSLPQLPDSLRLLSCNNNQLSSLPRLPNSLTSLSCHNNQLSSLPQLPRSLRLLTCSNNRLSSLPLLPRALTYLCCGGNQFVTQQENYLQKIIYCISPCKSTFMHNLFEFFSEKCLYCDCSFINIDKYIFTLWKNKDVVIKNQICYDCSQN